jgi:hypothetical protein
MWFILAVLAILWALTATAAADEVGRPDGHHGRAFWLNQAWPNPQDDASSQPKPKFTMTYTDGIASRFHGTDGGGFFAQKLGGSGAPALVGTVSHGAPVLELRWRMGE